MHALLLRCRRSDADAVIAELYELDTAGITEHDEPGGWCQLEAFFPDRFDASVQAPALVPLVIDWREHPDAAAAWVDTFEPFAVGARLFLVPAWREDPAPAGRLRLAVYARQASGSGYQPATQLALEALERHLRVPGRFLDVGTGSGILTSAAKLLALAECAGPRFACDLDPVALREARENRTPADLFAGSARAIASNTMTTVAANLNAESILSLAPDLVRVLAPGGRLILSGFTGRNLDRVLAAFSGHLSCLETLASDRWRALVLERPTTALPPR